MTQCRRSSTGQWLRSHFPGVARSMDRFIDKVKQETHGEVMGDLEIVRIPLNLYRARNATSRQLAHPCAPRPPVRRARRSFSSAIAAIGSPVLPVDFPGIRVAMFLAGLIAQRDLPVNGDARSL